MKEERISEEFIGTKIEQRMTLKIRLALIKRLVALGTLIMCTVWMLS